MDKQRAKDIIACRCAQELKDGYVVNLGIGIPTQCARYFPEGVDITLHAELGLIGQGPAPTPEPADPLHVVAASGNPATIIPGGAMDLVNGSKTFILAMIHTQGDKPKIVEKCTLPLTGYKVVDMIVTELCVLKVTPEGLELAEYNPELGDQDTAVRIIQEKTAAKLHISPDLKPMRLPD